MLLHLLEGRVLARFVALLEAPDGGHDSVALGSECLLLRLDCVGRRLHEALCGARRVGGVGRAREHGEGQNRHGHVSHWTPPKEKKGWVTTGAPSRARG